MKAFFTLLIMTLFVSCSPKTYGTFELYFMAKEIDPNIEYVLPKTMAEGVQCRDYGTGCLSGKRARVRLVLLTVVEFEKEEQARFAARQLDQWYARNWLFDDVTNEPVLEDFVQKAFNAKRAKFEKD